MEQSCPETGQEGDYSEAFVRVKSTTRFAEWS